MSHIGYQVLGSTPNRDLTLLSILNDLSLPTFLTRNTCNRINKTITINIDSKKLSDNMNPEMKQAL